MSNLTPGNWYQVNVGNIGDVYSGHSKTEAEKCFEEYKVLSCLSLGRASGESVVMFADNEIEKEFDGILS